MIDNEDGWFYNLKPFKTIGSKCLCQVIRKVHKSVPWYHWGISSIMPWCPKLPMRKALPVGLSISKLLSLRFSLFSDRMWLHPRVGRSWIRSATALFFALTSAYCSSCQQPTLENWVEGAVKTTDKWCEGAFVVSSVFPSLSRSAPAALCAAQGLFHFSRPLCCTGNAEYSSCVIKTFCLNTERSKGFSLLHYPKCLTLTGPWSLEV